MNSSSTRSFAVVTGASSGIGYELAKQFAQHNFDLLITANQSDLSEVVQTLSQLGAQVETSQTDLSTYEGVEALFQQIQTIGRPIDAIALNAGVGVGGDFTHQTDLAEEINLLKLNVISPVHLTKRIVQDMVARKQGRILFTASIAAIMPGPFEAVYAASKAFLRSFAEALRNELKDTGVTVTALLPGPTETNFFHRADMDDTRAGASSKDDAAQVAEQGFKALMSGEAEVVGGSLLTKIQAAAAKVMPEPLKAEMHRQLTEPGSGK